jgi:hypothetical protein
MKPDHDSTMREARIEESVCAIDYRWPMGDTKDFGLEKTQLNRMISRDHQSYQSEYQTKSRQPKRS